LKEAYYDWLLAKPLVGPLVTVSRLLPIVNQAKNTSFELEEFIEEEDE